MAVRAGGVPVSAAPSSVLLPLAVPRARAPENRGRGADRADPRGAPTVDLARQGVHGRRAWHHEHRDADRADVAESCAGRAAGARAAAGDAAGERELAEQSAGFGR